jgi:lipoprotein-releasing system ATP-binding protein
VIFPLRDFAVDIALDVAAPTALVGPSGAGKSTMLRLIAGLLRPASGEITCNGETWFGPGIDVPVERRRIGFVFQDYALFPHKNVIGNVAFEARRDPDDVLRQLGIEHLVHARTRDLSGGERQRVALARALVTEPACVLADEPTGNLDHTTAETIFDLMLELSRTLGTAFVIVTHDPELARRCDRVLRLTEHGLQPQA